MKRRLLIAAAIVLTCSGCAYYPYYYSDPYPYYYNSYDYGPYYYPYRPPAVYADPGWLFFYPNLYLDFSFHGHRSYHGHGRH